MDADYPDGVPTRRCEGDEGAYRTQTLGDSRGLSGVQHTRLDSRKAENALLSTIAYSSND
jgi:hypothetical protein